MIKKTLFLSITFLYFLSCYAVEPLNQCIVFLTRGQTSYLVLSQNTINYSIEPNISSLLTGTGDFRFFVGNLGMFTFNNLGEIPFEITISSSTYQGSGIAYRLINGASSCKFGLYINFDIDGNTIPFQNIIPTANPNLIRYSTAEISENDAFFFYLLQDEENTFTTGVYEGTFTLTFTYP